MGGHTTPRPAGTIIVSDPDSHRAIVEADTLQCVHCGAHWQVSPGSGKIRGFCTRCNGPVCGPKCRQCVPAEQQLENIEQGRPLDFRPVVSGFRWILQPGTFEFATTKLPPTKLLRRDL